MKLTLWKLLNKERQKSFLLNLLFLPITLFKRKVFCISLQRNGTTSVGKFLRDHGYLVAGHGEASRKWAHNWKEGKINKILKSIEFNSYQAFEDNICFMPYFYRILFHKYPNSKFILFYRDENEWFDSMIRHSNGKTLGNTYLHSMLYNRLGDFYKIYDENEKVEIFSTKVDNLLDLKKNKNHYTKFYKIYNRDIIEYFNHFGKDRLMHCSLEDEYKWVKLGAFLNVKVEDGYNPHENKSNNG